MRLYNTNSVWLVKTQYPYLSAFKKTEKIFCPGNHFYVSMLHISPEPHLFTLTDGLRYFVTVHANYAFQIMNAALFSLTSSSLTTQVNILDWDPLESSSHIFLFPVFLFRLPPFSLTFSTLLYSSLTHSHLSLSSSSWLIIPSRWRQLTKIHLIALTCRVLMSSQSPLCIAQCLPHNCPCDKKI